MILYSGSLIQQDFGENNIHGIVKWNVYDNKHEFIQIKNDYGFRTIYFLSDNQIVYNDDNNIIEIDFEYIKNNFPKYLSLRIQKNKEVSSNSLNDLIANIKLHFTIKDIVIMDLDDDKTIDNINSNKELETKLQDTQNNLNKVEYQNDLLKQLHSEVLGFELSDEQLLQLYTINNEINNNLPKTDTLYESTIKVEEMWFDNMFSYGENNYINFNNLHNIVGIFAPNQYGKSSIMQILLFMLYDTTSKISKTIDVLNVSKTNFYGKVKFSVSDNKYIIEKSGDLDKKGKLSFKVNLYKIDEDDNIIEDLNGEQRKDTNKNIFAIIGTYDNAVMTNIVLQNDSEFNFVNKTQTERRLLLSQFLGLDIYKSLYNTATNLNKTKKVEFEYLLKQNVNNELVESKDELDTLYTQIDLTTNKINDYNELIDKGNVKINDLKSKIINISTNNIDINLLINNKILLENEIEQLSQRLKLLNDSVIIYNNNIISCKNQIQNYDINDLTDKYNTYNNNIKILEKLNVSLSQSLTEKELLNSQISKDTSKLNQLNIDISDINNKIITNKSQIQNYDIDDLTTKYNTYNTNITTNNNIIVKLDNLKLKNKSIQNSTSILQGFNYDIDCNTCNNNLKIQQEGLKSLSNDYSINSKLIIELEEQYNKNISENNDLEKYVKQYTFYNNISNEIVESEKNKKDVDFSIKQTKSDIELKRSKLLNIQEKVNEQNNIILDNNNLVQYVKLYEFYTNISKELSKVEHDKTNNDYNIKQTNTEIELKKSNLINIIDKITEYNNNKGIIEKNKEYEVKINELNTIILSYDTEYKSLINNLKQYEIKKEILISKINELNIKYIRIQELETELKIMDNYISLVHHEGIPFQIMKQIVNKLNIEVNKILSQITNFILEVEIDNTNINIYMKQNNKRWLLELNSGMEGFISNIAVRIALSKITILPKTDFIFIDEGWSSLDSENLVKSTNLFTYLKQMYKYILIVSHIDTMKDMVDMQIDIDKKDGFSFINYK